MWECQCHEVQTEAQTEAFSAAEHDIGYLRFRRINLFWSSRTRCIINVEEKTSSSFMIHPDLTEYGEPMLVSTELFRTPLVSFLFERGWRQRFSVWGGFPGLEKQSVVGGNIVDASCGSGLFSRLFAKSGLFSLVDALDYSCECSFICGSLNYFCCYFLVLILVAKISRVLRLGRVFVTTAYILDGTFGFVPFLRPLRHQTRQISDSFIFLSEWEFEDLCKAYGLVGFTCKRNGAFVMISATKPT
ncbi:hypothetical protein UlMin_039888 [Ulmus minor]